MPEFNETLSAVRTVTQERTPSAAPLIAQSASNLLQLGAAVKDKVDVAGFRQDIATGQDVLETAQQDLKSVLNSVSPSDASGLEEIGVSIARQARAVDQGVRTRDQAALAINAMFKTFVAEHPHLTSQARQVVSAVGGSSSLGGSLGAPSTLSFQEKEALKQAAAIKNIQQTWGIPLEQASSIFAQLEQASVRTQLEPLNASDFSTGSNIKTFAGISTITSGIVSNVQTVLASGDIGQLSVIKNKGLAISAQARVAALQDVTSSAQSMARSGRFLSRETIDSQIENVNAQYDDLDTLLNGDLLDASKILRDRASFTATQGMDTYNKLFATAAQLANRAGNLRLAARAPTFFANTPESLNRHLSAFSAASNVLESMVKGETFREALGKLSLVGEERSEVQRAASFLQDAGATDIWSFLLSTSLAKAENPTPGGATVADDIEASATQSVLAPEGAKTALAIPHAVNSIANPQKYILSGPFFDMYGTALEEGNKDALLNMADNFTSSALAPLVKLTKDINKAGLTTNVLTINTETVTEEGEVVAARPIKPTGNASLVAIPFLQREVDISTIPTGVAVGSRIGQNLAGVTGAAQRLDDNILRLNYLLTFTMAQYGPDSIEFKNLFDRVMRTVKAGNIQPKKEESNIGNTFGTRIDGTQKGSGFFGKLERPDGAVSTELSIGVNIDNEEVLIPSLVPTLSAKEVNELLRSEGLPSDTIVEKAVAFARLRKKQGKPFFHEIGEKTFKIKKEESNE